jgi:hypothetical protein
MNPPYQQWILNLAEALGYTTEPDGDRPPSIYVLPVDEPFAFIEHTDRPTEVVAYEADGDENDRGMRGVRTVGNQFVWNAVRRPLPDEFELVTLTTDDGNTHRIALRKATA